MKTEAHHDWKQTIRGKLVFLSDKRPDLLDAKYTDQFIPAQYKTNQKLDSKGHMTYKYIINADGNSVRDAFPKFMVYVTQKKTQTKNKKIKIKNKKKFLFFS